MPSMVVISAPLTSWIGVVHDRMAAPLECTVHAPHSAMPQPNFVPVSCATSRRYHNSGISGSPSNVRSFPFTLKWIMVSPFELPSRIDFHLVCRLLLEKKKRDITAQHNT